MAQQFSGVNGRMSQRDFVLNAIKRLRLKDAKGIHVVYSGFNEAFRKYFEGADPVVTLKELEEDGVVAMRPAKGGPIVYDMTDLPPSMKRLLKDRPDRREKRGRAPTVGERALGKILE